MPNPVGWFEIPVSDMDRARTFYNVVFGYEMPLSEMDGVNMAWFPSDREGLGASGSLIQSEEHYTPSTKGVLVYFSCTDMEDVIAKIEPAGGKVLRPKTLIAENVGYMGLFIDSEGNRIALHSSS